MFMTAGVILCGGEIDTGCDCIDSSNLKWVCKSIYFVKDERHKRYEFELIAIMVIGSSD